MGVVAAIRDLPEERGSPVPAPARFAGLPARLGAGLAVAGFPAENGLLDALGPFFAAFGSASSQRFLPARPSGPPSGGGFWGKRTSPTASRRCPSERERAGEFLREGCLDGSRGVQLTTFNLARLRRLAFSDEYRSATARSEDGRRSKPLASPASASHRLHARDVRAHPVHGHHSSIFQYPTAARPPKPRPHEQLFSATTRAVQSPVRGSLDDFDERFGERRSAARRSGLREDRRRGGVELPSTRRGLRCHPLGRIWASHPGRTLAEYVTYAPDGFCFDDRTCWRALAGVRDGREVWEALGQDPSWRSSRSRSTGRETSWRGGARGEDTVALERSPEREEVERG